MIHLIDEQTLLEKLIKLIFLDIHGKSIWYNLNACEDTICYETYYCARGRLTWMEHFCVDYESLLAPGAQLRGEN